MSVYSDPWKVSEPYVVKLCFQHYKAAKGINKKRPIKAVEHETKSRGKNRERKRNLSTFKYQLWLKKRPKKRHVNIVWIVPYEETVHLWNLCLWKQKSVVPTYIIYTCAFIHMTNCAFVRFFTSEEQTELAQMPSAIAWSKVALQSGLCQNKPTALCNENPCWVWDQVHGNIAAHPWHWCLWAQPQVDSRCGQPSRLQLVKSHTHLCVTVTISSEFCNLLLKAADVWIGEWDQSHELS